MRRLILFPLCLFILGCGNGDVQLPQTKIAEFQGYDAAKFQRTLNIPANCRIVGFFSRGIVIENSSGTQFIVSGPEEGFAVPARVTKTLPELW